jgi:hypothetical protein
MGLIAGLLAQNLLKYFLNFGEVSYLQSYNALLNFFDDSVLLPNPQCNDENCVKLQNDFMANVGNFLSFKVFNFFLNFFFNFFYRNFPPENL